MAPGNAVLHRWDSHKLVGLETYAPDFEMQCEGGKHAQPFKSHWLGAALFIASLVQQKMLKEDRNKGLTFHLR